MNILFIGGTGLIGTAVGQQLATIEGVNLTLLHRGNREPTYRSDKLTILHGDARNSVEMQQLLAGKTFDVVVNWIAFTPEHIRQDSKLFSGKIAQYVFISSASAYQKPLRHYRITESTPLANPYWQYARDKAACETELQGTSLPYTIIRPSHTYGQGRLPFPMGAGKSWTPLQRMLDGKPVVVPGDGTSLWVTTYHTDFAQGMVGLLGQPRALGQAFHITSEEAMSWNNIVKTVAYGLGVTPAMVYLPSTVIEEKCPNFKGVLLGDKAESVVFDNSKIKEFVPGYQAKVTLAEGVRRCLAYWETHEKQIDQSYNNDMDFLTKLAKQAYSHLT